MVATDDRESAFAMASPGKNIRNLDLNLLIVFDAVYATRNVSHAAKQLSLTQPAVSNAIARLREQFNDPLFVRAGRGMAPTVKSQQMIEPVRDALRLIRHQMDGAQDLNLATYKRQFRIVIADPLEPLLMPPILRDISDQAPGVTIESRPAVHTRVVEDITAGTLDLACYPFLVSAPGLMIAPLMPCDHIIVSRRNHPRIGKKLDKDTLMSLGHVALIPELRGHVNVDRDITTRLGPRRIAYLVNKVWSVPAIVAASDLVCVLPRRFAMQMAPIFGLDIHESPAPVGDQHYHLIWHEKNNDDPGHRWLRDALMAAAGTEPGGVVAAPAGRKGRGAKLLAGRKRAA
jgi:DNA-binding transcriptional LysR family regulator